MQGCRGAVPQRVAKGRTCKAGDHCCLRLATPTPTPASQEALPLRPPAAGRSAGRSARPGHPSTGGSCRAPARRSTAWAGPLGRPGRGQSRLPAGRCCRPGRPPADEGVLGSGVRAVGNIGLGDEPGKQGTYFRVASGCHAPSQHQTLDWNRNRHKPAPSPLHRPAPSPSAPTSYISPFVSPLMLTQPP